MIQFTDFYDDIGFMAALFYNDKLKNADIYKIANHLNNKTFDDILAKIITNGSDDNNNKKLFENYLNTLGIKFSNPKRALIAKVFYYVLHNRVDFNRGIEFADNNVSEYEKTINHIGDDVGIEHILSKYYGINDRHVTDEKDIEATKKLIIKEMHQYVRDNLVEFPVNNGIRGVN